MNECDKEQIKKVIDVLYSVVTESDHANFTDMKVPYGELIELNNYCFHKAIFFEDKLREET